MMIGGLSSWGADVLVHSSRESCWVIISGHVYDLTGFLDEHPGGSSIILKYAGKDATKAYEPLHPAGTIERYLSEDAFKGLVQPEDSSQRLETASRSYKEGDRIPLILCMNLDDFERAAKLVLPKRVYAYFHSAADDLHTFHNNRQDWSKVMLRPRTLVDVRKVNTCRKIMSYFSNQPFFIAPAAMAGLAHPEGEMCLARGAVKHNIPYCVSTYSSVSHKELSRYLKQQNKGVLIFQLYVAKDAQRTRDLIREAKENGFKGILITVDTAVGGKREEDEFMQALAAYEAGEDDIPRPMYAVPGDHEPILRGAHSSSLSWEDIEWIKGEWGDVGPVYLKGIQCAEDARRALHMGIQGIYLSNHGGRQLDSASSSLRTLMEIRAFCPEVLHRLEVYLDGGVRRGTDVIKAICLGATAVSLGRPFMYALGAYGTHGVDKAIQILSDEVECTMRLMGVTSLDQLNSDYVNTAVLQRELPPEPSAFRARSLL